MARLEKPSMLLKMPGMMAQGDFQPRRARIQKHRGQESGRANMPRFLAEIRMGVLWGIGALGASGALGAGGGLIWRCNLLSGMPRFGFRSLIDHAMFHSSFNKIAGCGIMATKNNLTCMELFSGGGGLALGIEKGGFRHVAVVEYNENARKTIEENNRLGHYESPWPLLAEPDAKKVRYSDYRGKVDLIA